MTEYTEIFKNPGTVPLQVWIEPWHECLELAPGMTMTLVICHTSNDAPKIEANDTVVVYTMPSNSFVRVIVKDKIVKKFDWPDLFYVKDTPSPVVIESRHRPERPWWKVW